MNTYKFSNPLNQDEAADRFEVLEDRGDRVLVRSAVYCTDWAIRPTFAFMKSDLVPAHAVEQVDGGYRINGIEHLSDEAEALVDEAKQMAYSTGKMWQDVLLAICPQ